MKACRLLAALDGLAANVVLTLSEEEKRDYTAVVKILKGRYDPIHREKSARSEFSSRSRKKGETADEFGQALLLLSSRAYPGVADDSLLTNLLVERFVYGQTDLELTRYLGNLEKDNLHDLISSCVTYEYNNIRLAARKPAEPVFAMQPQSSPSPNWSSPASPPFHRDAWSMPNTPPMEVDYGEELQVDMVRNSGAPYNVPTPAQQMEIRDVAKQARGLGYTLRPWVAKQEDMQRQANPNRGSPASPGPNNRSPGPSPPANARPQIRHGNQPPATSSSAPRDTSTFQCWECGQMGHSRWQCTAGLTGLKFAPPRIRAEIQGAGQNTQQDLNA